MQNQFTVNIINEHVHQVFCVSFIFLFIIFVCFSKWCKIVKICIVHWYITLSMKIGLEYSNVNSAYKQSNILFGVEFIECFYLFIVFESLKLIDVNWLVFALVFILKWYALESRLNISLKALEYQIVDFFCVLWRYSIHIILYACKKLHFSFI